MGRKKKETVNEDITSNSIQISEEAIENAKKIKDDLHDKHKKLSEMQYFVKRKIYQLCLSIVDKQDALRQKVEDGEITPENLIYEVEEIGAMFGKLHYLKRMLLANVLIYTCSDISSKLSNISNILENLEVTSIFEQPDPTLGNAMPNQMPTFLHPPYYSTPAFSNAPIQQQGFPSVKFDAVSAMQQFNNVVEESKGSNKEDK